MSNAASLPKISLFPDLHNPRNVLLVACLIFLSALTWRAVGIGEYPAPHATNDEFHYLWGGLNFWENGEVMTWSGLAGSKRIGMGVYGATGFVMVSPAFDHPPLFTLLAGAAAKMTSPQRLVQQASDGRLMVLWDVNLARARLMMLPVFAAAFWLLFAVTRQAFGGPTALLTVLIYGFMSHSAAHGRLILADNLSVVWLLASVWAVQSWNHDKISRRTMAITVILTTAAALLTKVPAVCQVPVLIGLMIHARRLREIGFVIAGLILGAALYLGWALWFGFDNFISVMQAQAVRFRGFNAFQLISGAPRLIDLIDLNGILLAGWFCALIQVMQPRVSPVMIVLPVYALAFTFFAGDALFGWYSVPMHPWLALAVAVTTIQVYRRPRMAPVLGWMLLFLPWCVQGLYIGRLELRDSLRFGYMIAVAATVFLFALPRPQMIRAARLSMVTILALVLVREVYEVSFKREDRPADQERYF